MHRSLLRIVMAWALLSGFVHAGGVRIVERPSVPPFLTIQDAVDAALDGETLVVGQGNYASFTLTGKSLSVVCEGLGLVTVNGTVTISNLSGDGNALLSGFTITSAAGAGGPPGAALQGLKLIDNAGHVRVQSCTIKSGFVYSSFSLTAGAAVEASNCPQLAFVRCALRGVDLGYNSGEAASRGGDAFTAVNCGVALYDCTLQGGGGSQETVPGGDGGHGYLANGWGVTMSGSTLKGGQGGGADYLGCFVSGGGGDGLRLINAQAHVFDSGLFGGQPGTFGPCGLGPAGQPVHNQGGFVNFMNGAKRRLSAAAWASDQMPLVATVEGQPGDRVYVVVARVPDFEFLTSFHGTWLVPFFGLLPSVSVGVVPASGQVVVNLPIRDLRAPRVAQRLFLQAVCFDSAGKSYLSSPQHVTLLDRDAQPDCNGNGIFDLIDTISELGVVTDTDNDFIPDVCGGPPTTHWVDAAAPPGGDGSLLSPFQDIRTAIGVSASGHSVIVRDGLYVGAANRNLDFAGRDIVVRSENGAANCVIDCQGADRAFKVLSPSTLVARIEGFTIRNGSAALQAAAIHAYRVSVWDCVIEDCVIPGGAGSAGSGGAILATQIDLRRCEFRRNSAGAAGSNSLGGALVLSQFLPSPLTSIVQSCLFDAKSAARGGAISLSGSGMVQVTHCNFTQNQSWLHGGAIADHLGVGGWTGSLLVDQCQFAGNLAGTSGGALCVDSGTATGSSPLSLSNSTFAANQSGTNGGAIALHRNAQASIRNCILWNGSSPGGAELSLRFSSPVATLSWCDVRGGSAGVDWSAGTLNWGAGNLVIDPVFADPDGADNNPLTFGDNDYSLALASPCIDAGDNSGLAPDVGDIDGDGNFSELVPLDLAGLARRVDVVAVPDTGNGTAPIVDIGAFERP